MRTFLEVVDRMKEIQRIDSNKPGQDAAAKQRAERNTASKQRVADTEAKARVGAPERRAQTEKDQAAKSRADRNAAANKQVADAERKASPITSKSSRLGGTGGRKTMTSTARPANTIKAPSDFKKGTNSIKSPQSRPAAPTQTNKPAPTQTNKPAPKPKSNKYASSDEIRDTKFQDYKADRAERKGRQAEADKKKKTDNNIKTGKAIGKTVASAGRKALDIGRKSVTQGGEESRADSVQGSSEIIRGKRG